MKEKGQNDDQRPRENQHRTPAILQKNTGGKQTTDQEHRDKRSHSGRKSQIVMGGRLGGRQPSERPMK